MAGLARALSKLGYCSRAVAFSLVKGGRVRVNGRVVRDGEFGVMPERDLIEVDGRVVQVKAPVYVMLNKPRGLITSANDEKGRETVMSCLARPGINGEAALGGQHLGAVGRLDQASEGLLLLSNDHGWAHGITSPESHLSKTYHVQVRGLPSEAQLLRMTQGVSAGERGELLAVAAVRVLRHGQVNVWLEIRLNEGRNRQIRRICESLELPVLRLIRVAIGSLCLGELPKGAWRHLTDEERVGLTVPSE